MTRTTGGSGQANDLKRDVFCGHTRRQLARDFHLHVLRFFLDQRLGCQDVLDLGSTNSVRQGSECTVSRCMAITANNRHTRLCQSLLGTDDVDDTLTDIHDIEELDAEFFGI